MEGEMQNDYNGHAEMTSWSVDFPQNLDPETHVRMADRVFTEEDFNKSPLPIDEREIFDHIRDIKDPEYSMTLEELAVVELDLIKVDNERKCIYVEFKPTIPHCSLATLIGLSIKVQLLRTLPSCYKIDVSIVPGTHVSDSAINKQLADKERISAALENVHLHEVIDECVYLPEPQTLPKFVEKALQETNNLDHPKVLCIQRSRQHIETYRRWKEIINREIGKTHV